MAKRKRIKFGNNPTRAEVIEKVFRTVCEEFDDEKSTEFLVGITADMCGIDYQDVIDALVEIDEKEFSDG